MTRHIDKQQRTVLVTAVASSRVRKCGNKQKRERWWHILLTFYVWGRYSRFFFFLGLSIGPCKQEAALHDSTDQNTPAAGTISSAAVENRMLTPVGGKMLYLLKEGKKTTFDYVWDGMRPCVNVASSLIPFIWPFSHCSDCRWTFDKTFNSPFPEFPVGQGGINNSGSSFFFTKIFSLAIGLLCFAAIWHQQTELLR